MPLYGTDTDIWEEKPMPKYKKPNTKFPKDEMDEDLEMVEKGKTKQSALPTARRSFGGKKLSRPRFGGMMVGQ